MELGKPIREFDEPAEVPQGLPAKREREVEEPLAIPV